MHSSTIATPRFTPWNQAVLPPDPPTTPELIALGERVYRGACIGCHGATGEGDGREGKLLEIQPRDFTNADFMIRTTPSAMLPVDGDLFRSIRHGLRPDVGMPAFNFLTDKQVWAVIEYIKKFSDRWEDEEEYEPPIVIPTPPRRTPEALAAGAILYEKMGCLLCHGPKGLGDGAAAAAMKYPNGKPRRPANFTRPDLFKGGSRATDLYRTITIGMDGSPMPTFADAMPPKQRWQVVYYIMSLAKKPPAGK